MIDPLFKGNQLIKEKKILLIYWNIWDQFRICDLKFSMKQLHEERALGVLVSALTNSDNYQDYHLPFVKIVSHTVELKHIQT